MGEVPEVVVRVAVPGDGEMFISIVLGLAEFEKLPPPDAAGRARLLEDAFGPRPRFAVLLAEAGGVAAGYAVFFETYSTFLARPKLYLEDLFVSPGYRGRGVGLALFRACAAETVARGCARMEWVVLDWNEPAIKFYERLGAEYESQWHIYGLGAEALSRLAGG